MAEAAIQDGDEDLQRLGPGDGLGGCGVERGDQRHQRPARVVAESQQLGTAVEEGVEEMPVERGQEREDLPLDGEVWRRRRMGIVFKEISKRKDNLLSGRKSVCFGC